MSTPSLKQALIQLGVVDKHPSDEITKLSESDERRFQQWARANNIPDVDDPRSFYDYRGYWRDVASRGSDQRKRYEDGLHFPDTYKQHGHPTFSVESKYSTGPTDGGMWIGEQYVPQHLPRLSPHAQGAHASNPIQLAPLLIKAIELGLLKP